MANANVNLPYGVVKKIRVKGKNAANTAVKDVTNLTGGATFGVVTVVPVAGDPGLFNVTNTGPTSAGVGNIVWSAINELNQSISTATPITLIAADPATQLESTEEA